MVSILILLPTHIIPTPLAPDVLQMHAYAYAYAMHLALMSYRADSVCTWHEPSSCGTCRLVCGYIPCRGSYEAHGT